MEVNFSKRSWIFLWICLILLNVIMRIPVTPHEIGSDSFINHFVADSISAYGHAKWWLNPLSIVGLYPTSLESALPFYLSGISQSLSLVMEQAILVGLIILGILSSFTAYLMAGAIKDDESFKFITAFIYSTSPGILLYTTWNASGRGLFIVILPLFVYFIIKFSFNNLKYFLLTIAVFLLLIASHNMFYFLIPIILGYIIAATIGSIHFKSSNLLSGLILFIIFVIIYIQLSIRDAGIVSLILGYARYIGVMGIFSIGGFFYLLFKNKRSFEENFIVSYLLIFAPLLSVILYAKFFMLPFEALIASYGIFNLFKISKNRKSGYYIILIFLLLTIVVSEYYQFGRTDMEINQSEKFWAEESTVNAALWTKSFTNETAYADDAVLSRRVLAYSGASMPSDSNIVPLIQGNLKSFNVSTLSPFTILFYSEGPFHIENYSGLNNWVWYKLRNEGLDSKWGSL